MPRCLRALTTATLCVPVPVLTVVVLDACDDGSDRLAGRVRPRRAFRGGRGGQRRRRPRRRVRLRAIRVRHRARSGRTLVRHAPTPTAWSTADWLIADDCRDADMVLGVGAGDRLAELPGRGGPPLPARVQRERPGAQPRSRREHGFPGRRLLGVGGFTHAGDRRGRRPGGALRGGRHARFDRDAKLSVVDLGHAGWAGAQADSPAPPRAVRLDAANARSA